MFNIYLILNFQWILEVDLFSKKTYHVIFDTIYIIENQIYKRQWFVLKKGGLFK